MRRKQKLNGRGRLVRALLVVAFGAASVPLVSGPAWAAQAGGPCPEVTTPAFDPADLPGVEAGSGDAGPPQEFTYQPVEPGLPGSTAPTDEDLELLDTATDLTPGSREHALARWLAYNERKDRERAEYDRDPEGKKKPTRPLRWSRWLATYVRVFENRNRGQAFEDHARSRAGVGGNHGWTCQGALPGSPNNRRYDAFHEAARVALEMKSGAKHDAGQLREDIENVRAGWSVIYLFATEPTPATRKALTDAGIQVRVLPAQGKPPDQEETPPDPATEPARDLLRGPRQLPSTGPLPEAVTVSPETPAEAAAIVEAQAELAQEMGVPAGDLDDLGGVDFSTLELHYLADRPADGSEVRYAFSAAPAAEGEGSFGGLAAARQASDAFFVWLALDPTTFTVNLNPAEPDRIIDEALGQTDAGRVLLEADLLMKQTSSAFTHPDTELGARYWDSLRGDEEICISNRMWITADTATVYETGDELFILDAPLAVHMETDYFEDLVGTDLSGVGCPGSNRAHDQHNEEVFQELILPEVVAAVNGAPEFAELRRVYVSRVAAEWIRDRARTGQSAYSDLIDSGDVSAWTAPEPWDPQEVFDRFVASYTDGDYNVSRTTQRGNIIETATYFSGGVDLSVMPRAPVDADEFELSWAGLPEVVEAAMSGPTTDNTGELLWLGGATPVDPQLAATGPTDLSAAQLVRAVIVGLTIGVVLVGVLILVASRRPAGRPGNGPPPYPPSRH